MRRRRFIGMYRGLRKSVKGPRLLEIVPWAGWRAIRYVDRTGYDRQPSRSLAPAQRQRRGTSRHPVTPQSATFVLLIWGLLAYMQRPRVRNKCTISGNQR